MAAYYLADLLLGRAPIGADGPAVSVAFQRRHDDSIYDDIVVTIKSNWPIVLDIQVKRSVRFVPSDTSSVELVKDGLDSLRIHATEHDTGTRRLAVVTTPSSAVDQVSDLRDIALSHYRADEFYRLLGPGSTRASLRARADSLRDIVAMIMTDDSSDTRDHCLWRWLRTTTLIAIDGHSGSTHEQDVINRLSYVYEPPDHDRSRLLFNQLRILAADRAPHAGAVDREELVQALPYQLRPDVLLRGAASDLCTQVIGTMRERTRLAVEDAAHVSTVEGTDKTWHVRLDEVYVQRNADQQVLTFLQRERPLPILVSADAGYGKTSLLWSIYGALHGSNNCEVWFIRAPALLRRPGEEHFSIELETQLRDATRCCRSLGRQVIILMDTLDTLLHDDRERERALVLLRHMLGDGAALVATCRLQEARFVPLDFERVPLEPYSRDEIDTAVRDHAAAFAPDYGSSDIEGRVGEIVDATRWGTPLRPICQRPLTLRMLFEVYAPHEIPPEINTFALYEAFWQHRIRVDQRPGAQHPVDDYDLSPPAKRIALAMLEEGSPELHRAGLDMSPITRGIPLADLDRLGSRGVLAITLDRVTFFHQTLFEHAAARALGEDLGQPGLDALYERIGLYPNDAFLWPVLEHVLLLASKSARNFRTWSNHVLLDLLASNTEFGLDSGIFVYCQREDVSQAHISALTEVLRNSHPAVVKTFLRAAENLRAERMSELTSLLDIVWEREEWELRRMALEVLPRIGMMDPQEARRYLERNGILDFAIQIGSVKLIAPQLLAQTLVVMARVIPEWATSAVGQMLRGVEAVTPSKEVHTTVGQLVVSDGTKLGQHDLADVWFSLILGEGDTDDQSVLAHRLAPLWELQWDATAPGVRAIVDGLLASDKNAQHAMAAAFGPYVVKLPSEHILPAIEDLLTEAPLHVLWLLRSSLARIAMEHLSVRQFFVTTLRSWLAQPSPNLDRLRLLERVLSDVQITLDELRFAVGDLAETEGEWLESDALSVLLPAAAVSGQPATRKALYSLADRHGKDRSLHLDGLRRLAERDDEALSLLVSVTKAADRLGSLVPLLTRLAERDRARAAPWCDHLLDLATEQLQQRDPVRRRLGTHTMLQLVETALVDPPAGDNLAGWISRESDAVAQLHLLELGLLSLRRDSALAAKMVRATDPLLDDRHLGVREAARLLATEAGARLGNLDQAWSVALAVAFRSPVTARRISALAHVLQRTLLERPSAAVDRLLEVFALIPPTLSGKKRRHAGRGLFAVIRELFIQVPEAEQVRLLRGLGQIPRGFDRIVAVASFSARHTELLVEMDRLLQAEDVDGEVKRVIRQNKEQRQRAIGTTTWPRLVQLRGELEARL